jgi:hypothetical protein
LIEFNTKRINLLGSLQQHGYSFLDNAKTYSANNHYRQSMSHLKLFNSSFDIFSGVDKK